jgi:hypothetical protein
MFKFNTIFSDGLIDLEEFIQHMNNCDYAIEDIIVNLERIEFDIAILLFTYYDFLHTSEGLYEWAKVRIENRDIFCIQVQEQENERRQNLLQIAQDAKPWDQKLSSSIKKIKTWKSELQKYMDTYQTLIFDNFGKGKNVTITSNYFCRNLKLLSNKLRKYLTMVGMDFCPIDYSNITKLTVLLDIKKTQLIQQFNDLERIKIEESNKSNMDINGSSLKQETNNYNRYLYRACQKFCVNAKIYIRTEPVLYQTQWQTG